MKLVPSLAFLTAFLLILTSCNGNRQTPVEQPNPNEYASAEDAADAVQRMSAYDFTDTIQVSSHTYVYTIHREPSDSLPTVKDEFGTVFSDNIFTLTIRRDGTTFFERSFTKAAFSNLLSAEMRRNGVLDGMMCDSGLCFAVSISQPQSDFYEPFLLTVDDKGGIAIARDTRIDLN